MMASLRPALVAATRAALRIGKPATSSIRIPLRWQQQQQQHHRRRAVTTTAAAKTQKGGGKGGGAASGLLSGVHPESVEACTRIIAKAQAASDQWSVAYTDFLDPALAEAAMTCVGRVVLPGVCDSRVSDWLHMDV
jgi:hypothetical protein